MSRKSEGTIYLLHFARPYRHAKHYLGFAVHLDARLAHHGKASGARLMQVVREAGIDWQLARIWTGELPADAPPPEGSVDEGWN